MFVRGFIFLAGTRMWLLATEVWSREEPPGCSRAKMMVTTFPLWKPGEPSERATAPDVLPEEKGP